MKTNWRLGAGLLIVLLALALPRIAAASGMPALVGLATQVLIYGMAAASLNLALGYGGLVSFGHAAFFGLGGYVVGILYHHLHAGEPFLGFIPGSGDMLVTLPAAMLVAGVMAAIFGALSLRTSGVQFIMITLAFAQMLFFLFVSLKTYGGGDGLIIRRRNDLGPIDLRDNIDYYYTCLAITALFFLALWRIVRSRFGMVLVGTRQNDRRMAALGYSPYAYRLVGFILSGMGAGLAGALMADFARFVSPDMLHWTKSGDLIIMVILGGTGTLFGPLAGAAAFVVLENVLTGWTDNWQIVLGLVLLAVVLFTKGGLAALLPAASKERDA